MAWNEPGGGNNKDPWGGRNDQGPPDLDEVVKKMQDKLGGLFGGGRRSGGTGGSASGKGMAGFGLIAGIAFVVWLFSGIYIVDAGTRGVVMRFGAFTEATMPGPHWHIPYPVEQVEIVNVEQRRFVEIGYRSGAGGQAGLTVEREALMLTKDENIVNVQLAVQYQVDDPGKYLFNVRQPDAVLKQVAESAVREVIGKSEMDFVLKEGRAEVVSRVKASMQNVLNQYDSGMLVSDVNLQDAQPPEEVQGAFSDAIKAREDKERLKNEAETYANEVIPKARGRAARQTQEAQAYKESLIAKAEGEASRFTALLKEYKKAPEVTRKRLYLETMESVLTRTNKVLVDSDNANNLMYLPLDQLMKQSTARRSSGTNVSDAFTGTDSDKTVAPKRPARRTTRETR
ncbi:protease FtsH subunit HflK [Thiogranum longum]|uniref:Protein HflK n=1 Tax=Thiogranum longum TaxID=1537524 RepID=A0A4R1HP47_9GAMM|nr:FtsH protease activity modulator HflK [Thiogranum longum]TCK19052.1 protease FtsH subunit HflK [Thiogranum longum]